MRARRVTIRSKLVLTLATLLFVGVVGGVVGMTVLFAYFAKDLPSPDRVVRREGFATKIYDRNNNLLYDVYNDKKRTPVELNQVPMYLRQATIAVEDKSFYKHAGVDPLTPVRIIWNVITKQRLIGGSSLTQQLVKNSLLTSERTITRKLKEFILTIQVESKYSKDQILQMYFNETPYGGTAWGVEAASEMYFNKPVSQVTMPEAVILAGLPQSPTQYSPYVGKLYITRANEVLRRMREDGYITLQQETDTKKQLASVQVATQSGLLKAPHFVFYVKQKLIDRYGEKVVEEGGLRVTTTLDLKLQESAQKSVAEEIEKVKYLNITNGASVVMNPKNGQILAMVGSRDWNDPNYDGKYNVAIATRQPGSAIKPVTYLTGLRKGYTAATMLMDTKTSFPGGDQPDYIPENYDMKFRGPVLVRDALGNSLNIPAVKMLSLVGIKDMLQMAYDMGINDLQPTPEFMKRVGLSVTLGGGEVKLLDLVTAYSAFANGGYKVEPVSILKVTDTTGKVLEDWNDTQGKQVISPEEAYIISSILADPVARSITFGPRSSIVIPGRTISVKTGTTNNKKDNWTVGWTPSIITGVWVGNNNNTEMKQVASGITGAAPIWNRIIREALGNRPDEQIATPSGIVTVDVDLVSGYPAHDGFPSKKEYFIRGTEPTGEDPIHKKIKVCKNEGKLATQGDTNSGNYDEKEALYFKEEDPFLAVDKSNKWQEGIINWLNEQNDPKYHPPTEFCSGSNPMWITIKEPGDKSRINSNDVTIKVEVDDSSRVTQVEFYIDGALKQTMSTGPWELTVNLTNGNHKIDIKAKDENGNIGSRYVNIGVNQDYSGS
jgi:1A family penicillin-binding protein